MVRGELCLQPLGEAGAKPGHDHFLIGRGGVGGRRHGPARLCVRGGGRQGQRAGGRDQRCERKALRLVHDFTLSHPRVARAAMCPTPLPVRPANRSRSQLPDVSRARGQSPWHARIGRSWFSMLFFYIRGFGGSIPFFHRSSSVECLLERTGVPKAADRISASAQGKCRVARPRPAPGEDGLICDLLNERSEGGGCQSARLPARG